MRLAYISAAQKKTTLGNNISNDPLSSNCDLIFHKPFLPNRHQNQDFQ